MQDASERLKTIKRVEDPESIKVTKYGELACISATVDGTWQRRGGGGGGAVPKLLSYSLFLSGQEKIWMTF